MDHSETVALYPQMSSSQIQKNMDSKGDASQAVQVPQQIVQMTRTPLVLGPDNTVTTCPYCNMNIKTAVQYTTTARTHIAAALCCLVCCMCCIPYCADSAKNTDHYCPSCQRYLATYEK